MKKRFGKRCLAFVMSMVLCMQCCMVTAFAQAWNQSEYQKYLELRFWEDQEPDIGFYINAAARYELETVKEPNVGSTFGEWTVMDLLRGMYTGYDYINKIGDTYFDDYLYRMENYVEEKKGILDRYKVTEWCRLMLPLSAMGYDVTQVAGNYDFIDKLSQSHTASYRQGINGPVWELIAMDTLDYEFYEEPSNGAGEDTNTRGKLLDYILDHELSEGGWNLNRGVYGDTPDVDITGMAIQALAPYYLDSDKYEYTNASHTYKELQVSVERGIAWLAGKQQPHGGFHAWGNVNAESTAQVIVALTALNIDPKASEVNLPAIGKKVSFLKEGGRWDGVYTNNMVDHLLVFWAWDSGSGPETGGFKHVTAGDDGGGGAGTVVNAMATDQVLYALIAYDRFTKGLPKLYDMKEECGSYQNAKATEYQVTFDGNGYIDTNVSSASPYGIVTIPEAGKLENGMELTGWNTKPDGSGISYFPGERLSMPQQDITLYAQYGRVEFQITYELNGGSFAEGFQPETVYTPSTPDMTLPTDSQIICPGKIFQGWYVSSVFAGTPVTVQPEGSYGDKVYYAKYKIDYAPINAFIKIITNLPENIQLSDKPQIAEARRLYDSMADCQKEQIANSNVRTLLAAEKSVARLEALYTQAQAVTAKINEIPRPVTLESEAAITAARKAYSELTDEQKAMVDNYSKLVQAEQELLKWKSDTEAVSLAEEKIRGIGTVTMESKEAIELARASYNALTSAQKELVSEEVLQILTEAEAAWQKLAETDGKIYEAQQLIDGIYANSQEITLSSENAITDARSAYEALDYLQQKKVSNYERLLQAEAKLALLKQKKEAVDELSRRITEIGEVTPEKIDLLQDLKGQYRNLSPEEKEMLSPEIAETLNGAIQILSELAQQDESVDYEKTGLAEMKIAALGEVTLQSREDILACREQYEQLTNSEKALVENAYALFHAVRVLEKLELAEDEAAANRVTDLIGQMGEITLDSQEIVKNARSAYDALTEAQKALVSQETLRVLTESETTLAELLQEQQDALDKEAAEPVKNMIDAISEESFTLESQEKLDSLKLELEKIRQAYQQLTASQQKLVTNAAKLDQAEGLLSDYQEAYQVASGIDALPEKMTLSQEETLIRLQTLYQKLNEKQKAMISEEQTKKLQNAGNELESLRRIQNVQTLVDGIGEVTLKKDAVITAAWEKYELLSQEEKAQVKNVQALMEAREKLADLKKWKAAADDFTQRVNSLYTAIHEAVSLSDEARIQELLQEYKQLSEDEKAFVTVQTEEKLNSLSDELKTRRVSSLTLNKKILKLGKGEKAVLNAVIAPSTAQNTALIWKTSNSKVVKVTSLGRLTACGEGTAVVTVISEENPQIKAVCKVTVAYKGKWVKSSKGKLYYRYQYTDKTFARKTLRKIKGAYYYFKKNGYKAAGWKTIGKNRYYFHKKTGKAYTGKKKIGKATYFFEKNGVMAKKKWVTIGAKKYYFNKSGKLTKTKRR